MEEDLLKHQFVLNLILRRNVWQITARIVLLTAAVGPLSVGNGILVTTGLMTVTVSSVYVMMAGSARSQGMKAKILMKNTSLPTTSIPTRPTILKKSKGKKRVVAGCL